MASSSIQAARGRSEPHVLTSLSQSVKDFCALSQRQMPANIKKEYTATAHILAVLFRSRYGSQATAMLFEVVLRLQTLIESESSITWFSLDMK
jgi:hypothetical protein